MRNQYNTARMSRLSLSQVNVGNLLVLLGVGWLGFSFWLPYATAGRVFRIENRTSAIAERFTNAAAQMIEIDWTNDDLRDQMLASVNAAGGSTNPKSSLHLKAAVPPRHLRGHSFLFEGKHYLYLVTNTPKKILGIDPKIEKPDGGTKDPAPTVPPTGVPVPGSTPIPLPEDVKYPFETYAWPREAQIGARTAFFFPSDGRAAFTRNLSDRYVGMNRTPRPGDGRIEVESEKHENDYRGHDDERWIYKTRGAAKDD
jgi:hypothetical protein